jgi:glucose/arabinose dehydrogenase
MLRKSLSIWRATGMVFGPDHALYLSDYQGNRILRISRGKGH